MDKQLVFHDISMTLQEGMTTYPKDVPYRRVLQRDMGRGDSSNVSVIEMSAHTGTHVDAPRHYYAGGYGTERMPLGDLFGAVWVADCRGMAAVTGEVLAGKAPAGTERVLLKTDNSRRLHENPTGAFYQEFVYLEESGARYMAEQGIRLVGIDYLSIDKPGRAGKPAHHILLERNITIIEGVDLAAVEEGRYFLVCAPLKLAEGDGAPCRAVLIENF